MYISDSMVDRLKKMAYRQTMFEEGLNPMDASGGNYDDAYSVGYDDGVTGLARDVLRDLGIK